MTKAPLFSDLGACAHDLLNDDYNFDLKAEIKTVTANGVTFNSSITRDHKKNAITGVLKAKLKPCSWVNLEEVLDTNGKVQLNATADKFAEGLKVTAEGGLCGGYKAGLEYSHDVFSATATLDNNGTPKVVTSGVVQLNNVAVGIEAADFDVAQGKGTVQYKGDNFTVASKCVKKGEEVSASYIHNTKNDITVAAEYTHFKSKGKHSFEVGLKAKIDKDSNIRSKLNSEGIFSVVYSQLVRPGVNLKVSGQIDTQNLGKDSHKIGINVSADL